MKPRLAKQRNRAWTVIDIVVIIAVIAVLAAILLPVISSAKRRVLRTNCVSNLNQITMAFQVWKDEPVFRAWEAEGSNHVSASVSPTNRGMAEWHVTTNTFVVQWPVTTSAVGFFQVMSNEFSAPKILICPADESRIPATSFVTNFGNSNISYFINPDAAKRYTNQIMFGDANLAINGIAVNSGMVDFPTNAPISFTAARHKFVGNIGYADGSVAELSSYGLQQALVQTGIATNRLAIP